MEDTILSVVLYGCETWSLKLREERRLGESENRVLRRKIGSKKEELPGEWRNLHEEELKDLYCSPTTVRVIKSRRTRWEGHVARMGERRSIYRVFGGKMEGKGKTRHRWKDNIKMDLHEVGWGMDWIDMVQDRNRWRALVNAVMNLRFP